MSLSQFLELIDFLDTTNLDQPSIDQIKKKYHFLELTHPKLFKKLFEDPLNKENLSRSKEMILLYEKVQNGQITQHNASVQVGQELADTFLPKEN
jgi:hypothetical protein